MIIITISYLNLDRKFNAQLLDTLFSPTIRIFTITLYVYNQENINANNALQPPVQQKSNSILTLFSFDFIYHH